MTIPLIAVSALADNHVIGNDNRLIWRLKSDLKRFRSLTMGRPLIMGRKTFESIGKPLPGRYTVVLTRDAGWTYPGVVTVHTLEAALEAGQNLAEEHQSDAVVIGGGADVYAQTIEHCERLHLTYVHTNPEGDALFPAFARSEWVDTYRETRPGGPEDDHPFTFLDLKRRI